VRARRSTQAPNPEDSVKTLTAPLSAALLVLAATVASGSVQDGAGRAAAPAAPIPDAFHAGPQHALLQKLVGTWDAVLVAPDGKGGETRTQGTLTTSKHTDFHTVDAFSGDFMGMKLIGHGMNGFCTVRKKFFSYWTDSMTSSPLIAYGDWNEKTRQLEMQGECYGPSGTLEPVRTVLQLTDDDHRTWTLYGRGLDGKDFQLLRIEYTRQR
jgi:hypothetical protein